MFVVFCFEVLEKALQSLLDFLAESLLALCEGNQPLEVLVGIFIEIDGVVQRLPALRFLELPFVELLLEALLAEQHVVFSVDFDYLLKVSTANQLIFWVLEQLFELLERKCLVFTKHPHQKFNDIGILDGGWLVLLLLVLFIIERTILFAAS